MFLSIHWVASVLLAASIAFAMGPTKTIPKTNALIHNHGRWDQTGSTWWAGTGFKLHLRGLNHLVLNLGNLTTSPQVAVGLSINYSNFTTLNLTSGANTISLPSQKPGSSTVLRFNVEGWVNNRLQLESIVVNSDAALLEYAQSPLKFQFIGDSLTSGQYDPNGVDDSWGFVVAETLKAEYQINAMPGGCLTDQNCWGNVRGVSHQFFQTQDVQYYYDLAQNYSHPWNFALEVPKPTHVVVAIGANDASFSISEDSFTATFTSFVDRLRGVYPDATIFILAPWGWPASDGSVSYYLEDSYPAVITKRNAVFDTNIHLIDAAGWVSWADVYPDNQHPTPEGHARIAAHFVSALASLGIYPEKAWPTKV